MKSFKMSSYSLYIALAILAIVKDGGSLVLKNANDAGTQTISHVGDQWLNSYPIVPTVGDRMKRSPDVRNFPQESDKLDSAPDPDSMTNQKHRPLGSRSSSRFPVPFCELEIDTGIICPGLRRGLHLEQFHYDVDNNRCSHFVYNGCGGNANRFSSLWECTQSCVKQ